MCLMQARSGVAALGWAAACVACAVGGTGRALAQSGTQPARDVSNVLFRGDSTIMNMKVGATEFSAGGFRIVTTGARFEYAAGELRVFQGLTEPRRLVATFTLSGAPTFESCEWNDDHRLLWSADVNLGIYGDSTLIIAPKAALNVRGVGDFQPAFEAQYRGELLLIDGPGGLAVVPQRYGPAYVVRELELGKRDWVVAYGLPAGQRLMVTAFPGRAFDWEKSFHSNMLMTYGGLGLGTGNVYGQMPSEAEVTAWSSLFEIAYVSFEGLYERADPKREMPHPGGPYRVANASEFRRFVTAAHKHGVKVTPYASVYYFVQRGGTMEGYFSEVGALQRDFQIDGVYVDALLNDTRYDRNIDDAVASWEAVRRLRQMFGKDGVIIVHATAIGNPIGVLPNMSTYCDIVINGEGVQSTSANDPYVRYRVRQYGISNTIGIWYSAIESGLSWSEQLQAILGMHCRMLWGAYVPFGVPPPDNHYTWGTQPDAQYLAYRRALQKVEDEYRRGIQGGGGSTP